MNRTNSIKLTHTNLYIGAIPSTQKTEPYFFPDHLETISDCPEKGSVAPHAGVLVRDTATALTLDTAAQLPATYAQRWQPGKVQPFQARPLQRDSTTLLCISPCNRDTACCAHSDWCWRATNVRQCASPNVSRHHFFPRGSVSCIITNSSPTTTRRNHAPMSHE